MKKTTKTVFILLFALIVSSCALSACDLFGAGTLSVEFDDTHEIYVGDSLESLKPYVTVKLTDKMGNVREITDYTLSGTLQLGENKVKVSYGGTELEVTVFVKDPFEEFTVTFKADGVVVNEQQYSHANPNVTVPQVPAKTGYNGAWEQYTLTSGNVTVNAVYTAKQYTVTLDYNGATDGNSQKTVTVTYNQAIGTLPTPTKTGYAFAGWTLNGESVTSETVWTFDLDNAELIAVYTAKQYTVTLNYNGATDGNSQKTVTVTYNQAIGTLPTPTKTGYSFAGWTLNGQAVTSETIWNLDVDEATLVANWETVYTVTFKADEVVVGTQNYTESNKQITEPAVPAKTGYNGAWEQYALTSGNVTVNAVYTAKQYTVTLDYNGATDGNSQKTVTVTYNQAIGTLPTPTKTGHIFSGWTLNGEAVTSETIWNLDVDEATFAAQWIYGTNGLAYFINSDNQSYRVTGIGSVTDTEIVIPATHNGLPVTSIGSSAFRNHSSLTSVEIPNSVTSIGDWTFAGSSLTSVTIGNSVTSIGDSAFYNCRSLTSVEIPNSVTSISEEAFSGCSSLTSVTIGNGVTSIGFYAFSGCIGLTSVEIGNSVTSIGYRAFYECRSLTSVEIPDSVTSIGTSAFEYCSSLLSITLPFVGASKDGMFNTHFGYIFGANTYSDQGGYIPSSLKSVVITSATSISDYAFYNCSSLTSVVIPNSVTSIGDKAFEGCSSLQFNEYGNALYLGNDENPHLALIKAKDTSISSCEIHNETKIIADSAFYDCRSLTSVEIPNSVTSIGFSAFAWCSSLTSVEIPNSVTSIGKEAFEACSSLTSVEIPNSVTSIGHAAFEGCSSLTSVEIPNSVTSMGYMVFSGCSSLTSIVIPNSVPSIGDGAFYDCSSLTSIVIPNSVTLIGDSAFSWCSSLTSVKIPNTVTSIGELAFYGCSSLKSIVIPNGVPSIGYMAFAYCSSLTSVTIGNGVETIGSSAFSGCSSLTSIVIPNSVTSIGYGSFWGCSNLTSIVIPNSVTSIGDHAFEDCNSLQFNEYGNALYLGNDENPHLALIKAKDTSISSCEINNETKIIADSAFYICRSLTGVTIGNSVTSIGRSAFVGCSLTSVEIPNSVTSIGYGAFENCSSLTSVTIGNSVTSIGDHAFYYCLKLVEVYNLSSLNIAKGYSDFGYVAYYALNVYTPESGESNITATSDDFIFYQDGETIYLLGYTGTATDVTLPNSFNGKHYSVYEFAFRGCSSLTSVTIGNSVTSIGRCAFYNCSSLTSVTIGNGVETIGSSAFSGCSSLTSVVIPNSVTSIGDGAFWDCSSLTNIVIPSSVTSIGKNALYNCSNFNVVYYGGTESDWEKITIDTDNFNLTANMRYYFSETEPALNDEGTEYNGDFWHYDAEGNPVVWVYANND